jgi:AraC family transcriptional regulator, positive regulator of tynA and feaB
VVESFSTRGLPAAKKLSFWNGIASDTFAAMEVRPHDATLFHGTLQRVHLGALTVMSVCSSAVRIRHTREHIARMATPSYLLLAPLQREMELSTEGAAPIRVRAGEFCLIDHARTYELTHGDSVRTLCIDIPRDRMEARVPHASEMVGRLMKPDSASSRVLLAVLSTLGQEMRPSDGTGLSSAFGESVLSVVAATYLACTENATGRGPGARSKAFHAYIDSRLADPDLTPAEVASYVGVSERYLRSVLASEGESFSSYVLGQRLQRCAQLLADAGWRDRTITQIAFHSGFSNVTYFGQAFKARFGMTPSDYRLGRARLTRGEGPWSRFK